MGAQGEMGREKAPRSPCAMPRVVRRRLMTSDTSCTAVILLYNINNHLPVWKSFRVQWAHVVHLLQMRVTIKKHIILDFICLFRSKFANDIIGRLSANCR